MYIVQFTPYNVQFKIVTAYKETVRRIVTMPLLSISPPKDIAIQKGSHYKQKFRFYLNYL